MPEYYEIKIKGSSGSTLVGLVCRSDIDAPGRGRNPAYRRPPRPGRAPRPARTHPRPEYHFDLGYLRRPIHPEFR